MDDSESIKKQISEAQERIGKYNERMELETDERQKEFLYGHVKDEVAQTKYLSVQLAEAEDRESKLAAQEAVNPEKKALDTVDPVLIRTLIQQNLPTIRPALRLTAALILAQLSEFRERVRSDNHLRLEHEQFHDELLLMLDHLAVDIETLLGTVSDSNGPAAEEEVEATAGWIESFQSRIEEKMIACSDSSKAADIVFPVGITLGFGAIGAIIGAAFGQGVAGFVAGGFLAKVALGEAKPSEVTSKIEKEIGNNGASKDEQQI